MHLIVLHDTAGSSNPIGVSSNYDKIPLAPYYIFKDLITIFLFIIGLSLFAFFMPNVLGDSENYVMANPMQTPAAIVPEWYLLPFYAILRSISNKLLGVLAMFSAILVLLVLPFFDFSIYRGLQFKPLSKLLFFVFIANFLALMILGSKHVESPYILLGQLSTIVYFLHFLIIVPVLSLLEKILSGSVLMYNAKIRCSIIKFIKAKKAYNNKKMIPHLLYSWPNIVIIFIVGFISRFFINEYLDINVFHEYTHYISLLYYMGMASVISFISDLKIEFTSIIRGLKLLLESLHLHKMGIDNSYDISYKYEDRNNINMCKDNTNRLPPTGEDPDTPYLADNESDTLADNESVNSDNESVNGDNESVNSINSTDIKDRHLLSASVDNFLPPACELTDEYNDDQNSDRLSKHVDSALNNLDATHNTKLETINNDLADSRISEEYARVAKQTLNNDVE